MSELDSSFFLSFLFSFCADAFISLLRASFSKRRQKRSNSCDWLKESTSITVLELSVCFLRAHRVLSMWIFFHACAVSFLYWFINIYLSILFRRSINCIIIKTYWRLWCSEGHQAKTCFFIVWNSCSSEVEICAVTRNDYLTDTYVVGISICDVQFRPLFWKTLV